MSLSKDLRKHLDTAYGLLAKIPVAGEAVDLMALARQELRAAFALVKEENDTDGE